MLAARWAAMGLGNIGPGKGGVSGSAQASGGKGGFDPVHHIAARSGTEPIPQHHIRARVAGAGMGLDRLMRHGVAVDQNRLTKLCKAFIQKSFQRRVIRHPVAGNALICFGPWQFAAIDGAATRHDTRNNTKPGRDAGIVRGAVDPFDDRGVKFIGGAVQVDIGTGDAGSDQGRSVLGRGGKEVIDKGIFG